MPNFDRTGPRGQGPRSGRGQGKCRKINPASGPGQGAGPDRNQDWNGGFGKRDQKGGRRFFREDSNRRRNIDQ